MDGLATVIVIFILFWAGVCKIFLDILHSDEEKWK